MSHAVLTNKAGLELPDGNLYPLSATTVILTDEQFAMLSPSAFSGSSPALTDLGVVSLDGTTSGLQNTVASTNSATAPAAFAAVVSIAAMSLPVGWWRVRAWGGYTVGTPATAEQRAGGNMELFIGSNVVTSLPIPPVLGMYGPFTFMVKLDGLSSLAVGAVQAGTTGVAYTASLTADLLNGYPTSWAV